MTESTPPPINLSRLSNVGQVATAILVAIHTDVPVARTHAQIEQVPHQDIDSVEGALLITATLLQDRATRRAHESSPDGAVTFESPMTSEIGEVLGGPDQVRQITADLQELLETWATNDAVTQALLGRYGRRWAHAGLYQLALTTAALLPAGQAAWVDLGWAVDRLADLEASSGW